MSRKYARITLPMMQRMQALRRIELSCEAIARVIELDYGVKPAPGTVRAYTDSPYTVKGRPRGVAGVGSYNGVAPPRVAA